MADETINAAAGQFASLLGGESGPEEKDSDNGPDGSEGGATKDPQEAESPAAESEADESTEPVSTLSELAEKLGVDVSELYKITVPATSGDGRAELTLSELKDAWQEQSKLAHRTREIETGKQALEAAQQQAAKAWEHRMHEAASIYQHLEQQLAGEFNAIDWPTLRAEDPAEYAAKRHEFTEKNGHLQQLKAQASQQYEQHLYSQQEQQKQQYASYLQAEGERLLRALPDWQDSAVAAKSKGELRDYLVAAGFSAEEVGNVADHRSVLIARKAMLYDRQQADIATAKKRVVALPKVQKPGAGTTAKQEKDERKTSNLKQLRKSGHVRDAAALFIDLI